MDRQQVDRWLAAYVAAWKSYDRDAIGALFAADATRAGLGSDDVESAEPLL
jgi:hypothetical protein